MTQLTLCPCTDLAARYCRSLALWQEATLYSIRPGAAVGLVAASLFADNALYAEVYGAGGDGTRHERCSGSIYGTGDGSAFVASCVFMLSVLVWVAATMSVCFGILRIAGQLRNAPTAALSAEGGMIWMP